MNSRENFLKLYRHEPAQWVPADGPFDMCFVPGEHGASGMPAGSVGLDWFGVSWTISEAVGGLAGTPTPGVYVLEDISQWYEKDVIPSDEKINSFDWDGWAKRVTANWDRNERISVLGCSAGFLERLHHLMPFEEALCAFYEDPDAVEEYLDALLEYKKKVIKKAAEAVHPDVIVFMDDYGASRSTFLSESMWLEFIAPRLREIIRYCHELGLFFEMHSCGYITPLVKHMVDMGIDAIQPLQALNDVKMIKEQFGDRLTIHGGITASDLVGAPDQETLEKYVKECVDICAPGGNFIVMLSECERCAPDVSAAFKKYLNEAGWEYK